MNDLRSNQRFFVGKLIFLFFILLGSTSTMAKITGVPAMGVWDSKCYGDGVSIGYGSGSDADFCWFTSSSNPALFHKYMQPRTVAKATLTAEFTSSYVPYSGLYRLREHFCLASTKGWCSMREGQYFLDSANSISLVSSKTISEQNPNFGGGAQSMQIPSSYTLCITLVDQQGYEWRTPSDKITCSDAGMLPSTPATCYLNSSLDLNVEMGTLERGKIAIVPASGTTGNIKKSFPVLCTRDAGVTVSTTFQFTPLTVSGNEVISTSSANLGVAIFYNGKLVGPSSTAITETFGAGYTDLELEFQAVRNSVAELKDIPTGDFTASAVMVMTEQ